MDKEIVSALIGAGSAIGVMFVKDIGYDLIKVLQVNRSSTKRTYSIYTAPIVKSTESLCWRIKEIFDNRGAFLLQSGLRNEFYEYKFRSTVYRLGVVIGWIRALEREFAIINTTSSRENLKVVEAMEGLKSALADGQHIELAVLKDLARIWKLQLEHLTEKEKGLLAIRLENKIDDTVDRVAVKSARDLAELKQVELLLELSSIICTTIRVQQLSRERILEDREKALDTICRTMSWLYRDWQSDIGQQMIRKVENGSRKFEVIDFGEFESKLISEKPIWTQRLERLFADLNVEYVSASDDRVDQLKRIYTKTLILLRTFADLDRRHNVAALKSIEHLSEFQKMLIETK